MIASPKDSGQYACLAANSIGFTSQNFTLDVQGKESIFHGGSLVINFISVPPYLKGPVADKITVEEGELAELKCPIEGHPPPSILWLKNAAVINTKNDQK